MDIAFAQDPFRSAKMAGLCRVASLTLYYTSKEKNGKQAIKYLFDHKISDANEDVQIKKN